MEQDNNKKQDEERSATANIRQTNQQQNEQGEIKMGGSEFTGNGTDMETSSSGLPTMNPEQGVDDSASQHLGKARKS